MTTRLNYLKKSLNTDCYGSLIPTEDMELNFQELSQRLEINDVSQEVNYTLSKSMIRTFGKMFMNLNSCYDFYHVKLYEKLAYGPKSRIGPLALNIIKNSGPKFRKKALKIFSKISRILGFQHIQTNNGTDDDIPQIERAISSVNGKLTITVGEIKPRSKLFKL